MLKVVLSENAYDPEFYSLYSRMFPENEKIPQKNLMRTFGRGGQIFKFYDSDLYVGFCYTFEVNGIIFLVYIATRPDLWGRGYGSEILDYISTYKKHRHIFLVVEKEEGTPEEIRIRHRRKEFYRRNGWKDTGCELLSDGYYFDSMYIDDPISEDMMISTIKYYEEIHTGIR